jgi:hypothetical protein
MNKSTISISELAHRILMERKMSKWIAEIDESWSTMIGSLNENMPSGIDNALLGVTNKIDAAGEDVGDEDVQAALLVAALEKDGKLSTISPEDVKKQMPTVSERNNSKLNENAGGAIVVIEQLSLVLGNAALVEEICKVIEKVTGKKADPTKFTAAVNKVASFMKKVTGWPMKQIGKAIEWIIKKLGGGESAQTIGKYSVKLIIIGVMFVIAVMFFPLAGVSAIGIVLSVTALIGKGFELVNLTKGLVKAIKTASQTGSSESPAPATA